MKVKTTINFIFPLTIICFTLFSKWWIADVLDGTDGIMYGFPFIYRSPVFYTSVTEQIFILEFLADFLFYFIAIFMIYLTLRKFYPTIVIRKWIVRTIQVFAALLVCFELFIGISLETKLAFNRDFEIEIKQTGFKFYFSSGERDVYNKSHH